MNFKIDGFEFEATSKSSINGFDFGENLVKAYRKTVADIADAEPLPEVKDPNVPAEGANLATSPAPAVSAPAKPAEEPQDPKEVDLHEKLGASEVVNKANSILSELTKTLSSTYGLGLCYVHAIKTSGKTTKGSGVFHMVVTPLNYLGKQIGPDEKTANVILLGSIKINFTPAPKLNLLEGSDIGCLKLDEVTGFVKVFKDLLLNSMEIEFPNAKDVVKKEVGGGDVKGRVGTPFKGKVPYVDNATVVWS